MEQLLSIVLFTYTFPINSNMNYQYLTTEIRNFFQTRKTSMTTSVAAYSKILF